MFSKTKIIQYIQDKQIQDGGFCSYKVEPSSGADTYYAVLSLRMLDSFPKNFSGIQHFWESEIKNNNITDLTSLFFYTQVYKTLGLQYKQEKKFTSIIRHALDNDNVFKIKYFHIQNPKTDITDPSANSVFIDILENELRDIYFLYILCQDYGINDPRNRILNFVLSQKDSNGGFGKIQGPQIATTYYALRILLDCRITMNFNETRTYIQSKEHTIYYLEDFYWYTECLKMLDLPLPDHEYQAKFLHDCSRNDGGFSRSRNLGITTLEYTYYAVWLLKHMKEI